MLTSARDPTQSKPKQATLEVGLEVLGEPTKLVKPDSMPDTLTCGFVGACAPRGAPPPAHPAPLSRVAACDTRPPCRPACRRPIREPAADRVAGEPDAGGFYSKVNRNVRDMSAKGAAPGTDSKGRIGA